MRRPIKASIITGELNFDGIYCLTHADFPDDTTNDGNINPIEGITLGGASAMQQGATDLAFSLDEAGNTRLALEVVRAELSATPANSRLEVWVRVAPAPSDIVDTDIWAWWGDEAETQPAVTAPYGRNDVWNGTTGTGVPVVTNRVNHFDELATDPTPEYKDSSGNGHHAQTNGTNPTRVDLTPGRGQQGAALVSVDELVPGTADYAVVIFCSRTTNTTAFDPYYQYNGGNPPYCGGYISGSAYRVDIGTQRYDFTWGNAITSPLMAMMSRDGDSVTVVGNDQYNATRTGYASESPGIAGKQTEFANQSAITYSMYWVMMSAPNVAWGIALYRNVVAGTLFDRTYGIQPAAVYSTILFDSLNAGTEVRVYEEPHPQIWTLDLDAATPAGLANTYVAFQIQGSSAASDHYIWFRNNGSGTDPAPGGTGHRVDTATGDTDAEMAEAAQAILTAITDLGATFDGTVITVTNDRNGELTTPADGGTDATITLTQCGGTDATEIDGIESSTGTSWTANYSILRPRRAMIVMLSIAYENVRYSTILTTAGLVVPAGALQREDRNYYNPA